MRTYGQYCPIARGAEIFAERWTPLIIRNLYLGCGSFSEILEGAPGLSRTLLSQRLKHLERLGIVESAAKPDGRGRHYELTRAGHDLFTVCRSLGEWGAHWLEIAPEHLDPFVALWSMCNMLRRDRLPDRRVVIRFDFTGRQRAERYWLLIEHGEPEICKTCPGLDEDLYITAEAEAFVKWHAGQLTWAEATRDGRIQLHGPSWLVRAFPTWNARSAFAHIKPVSRTAASLAGSMPRISSGSLASNGSPTDGGTFGLGASVSVSPVTPTNSAVRPAPKPAIATAPAAPGRGSCLRSGRGGRGRTGRAWRSCGVPVGNGHGVLLGCVGHWSPVRLEVEPGRVADPGQRRGSAVAAVAVAWRGERLTPPGRCRCGGTAGTLPSSGLASPAPRRCRPAHRGRGSRSG